MLFSNDVILEQLGQLNTARLACAESAYDHTIEEMQQAVDTLDVAQDWFKDRGIKLVYDGETGQHWLAPEQASWHHPRKPSSFSTYLERLDSARRRSSRW